MDTLSQIIIFLDNENKQFRGELNDTSAIKEAMVVVGHRPQLGKTKSAEVYSVSKLGTRFVRDSDPVITIRCNENKQFWG